jgi:hypothetical protein
MKTDRELLELTAEAAGIQIHSIMDECEEDDSPMICIIREGKELRGWNPLLDDGDALRLAVKLRMKLHILDYGASARVNDDDKWSACESHLHGGIEKATRRAIVRAAATIAESQIQGREK